MIRFIFCLLLMSFFTMSQAQEQWPLEKCIEQAISSSIDAQISALSLNFSDVDIQAAKHARYPSLNANSSANWNFGRTIDPTTNEFNTSTFFSNNLSFNTGVTLYDGGRIGNNIKLAKMIKKANMADHDQVIRTTSLAVASFYLNAIFAQENERISRNQLAQSERQLNQINILIESGSRPRNEALDIQAQISRDRQNIILAENNYSNAMLSLKQLLRLDPGTNMQLVIPSLENFETTNPLLVNFDEAYQTALVTQPDIAAGEFRLQSSEIQKKIAKSAGIPSINVGGSLGTNYSNIGRTNLGNSIEDINTPVLINGDPAVVTTVQSIPNFVDADYGTQLDENIQYGFGVGLQVPIYNNYSVKANVERAELQIENDKLNNERLKDNLKTTVLQSLSDARAAKLSLEASESSLEAQRASFENTEKKYNLGAVNTFEYTSARNLLDNAEIDALISKYDYIFKLKTLEFYMGKPLKLQ